MHHRSLTVVTAAIAVTTVLSPVMIANAGSAHPAHHSKVRGERITVTRTTCAPHWRAPNAGRDHFAIANLSSHPLTMYLFHPVSDRIVATADGIKPHRVQELTVRLRAGDHYIWGCDLKNRPDRVSDSEIVPVDPTHGGSGPVVVPVTRDQLVAPMRAYRTYVAGLLRTLTTQAADLHADLSANEVSAAKHAWLTAHRTWLRIGQDDGAYGAFGDLGQAIDGMANGLRKGTADPAFTGFHRIEFDLWTRHAPATAANDTTHLQRLLTKLQRPGLASWFPMTTASVSGLPLRTHESLEDGLRDSLSGDDDYGSGTGLASVRSDVGAARELLNLVAPLVIPRSHHLVARAHRALHRLANALEQSRSHGRWVAVATVPRARREAVDAAIGRALEILAPVPDLLTIGKS